jgi:hypothetical protein
MDKEILRRQKQRITSLRSEPSGSPEFTAWEAQTERAIIQVFGAESIELKQFNGIHYFRQAVSPSTTPEDHERYFQYGLSKAEALLDSFVEDLDVTRGEDPKYERLTCPFCKSINPEYLETKEVKQTDYDAAIKFMGTDGGKHQRTLEFTSLYKCRICKSVFPVEVRLPEKTGKSED